VPAGDHTPVGQHRHRGRLAVVAAQLMELNGWTSPQMLRRYGASARNARARRSYDRIMDNTT
jgi:hypothetical protein